MIALGIYSASPRPTHNQITLKAVAADARLLMAAHPVRATQDWIYIPKDQWPSAIAKLNPEFVTVGYGTVDITTKPFLDGGWGYGFAIDDRHLEKCWSKLGHGMFWHNPC
ncbi:hypothetical protein F4U94_17005 [Sphingobium limneticum]|uniref:hypothetical protein n=1 Tax=Sphingobium limneticum TaxID=1007511 RepID=UPI00123D5271|nr:hypothetical protein [Sphingobium limneticum]KAA9013005.1 hypothetical protein F4U94_17005 [Sphingobium limneticum]